MEDLQVGMYLWWTFSDEACGWSNPICVTGVDLQKKIFTVVDLQTMKELGLDDDGCDERDLEDMRKCTQLEVNDYIHRQMMELATQKSRAAVELAQKTAKLKAYEKAAKPYLKS